MSHKLIVSGINKYVKKRPSQNYQSESIYTSKKSKKEINSYQFNLTAYESGYEILDNEVDVAKLDTVGYGLMSLPGNASGQDVKQKIVNTVSKMKFIAPSANLNTYKFLKRKGRTTKYTLQVTDDDFEYDIKALNKLKTKDASTIYILYENTIVDGEAKSRAQTPLTVEKKTSRKPSRSIKSTRPTELNEMNESDSSWSSDEGNCKSIDSIKKKIDNLFPGEVIIIV